MIELTTRAHLKDNVNISCVVEASEHLDDVGMVKKHLDLYFTDKLISDFLLVQQFFLYNL